MNIFLQPWLWLVKIENISSLSGKNTENLSGKLINHRPIELIVELNFVFVLINFCI